MSEKLEQENKKEVTIFIGQDTKVDTFLSEDEVVDLLAVFQSDKEGVVSVISGPYRVFLKAREMIGIQLKIEEKI